MPRFSLPYPSTLLPRRFVVATRKYQEVVLMDSSRQRQQLARLRNAAAFPPLMRQGHFIQPHVNGAHVMPSQVTKASEPGFSACRNPQSHFPTDDT